MSQCLFIVIMIMKLQWHGRLQYCCSSILQSLQLADEDVRKHVDEPCAFGVVLVHGTGMVYCAALLVLPTKWFHCYQLATPLRHCVLSYVWPTMSCFADWSKRRHVTLSIIIWSTLHGHPVWHYNVTRVSYVLSVWRHVMFIKCKHKIYSTLFLFTFSLFFGIWL